MNVLLPTPGTPVTPTRRDRPACGSTASSTAAAALGIVGPLALDEGDRPREDRAVAREDAVDIRGNGQARCRHAARDVPSASRICCAQSGMTLPGPKIAATPAC